MTEKSAIAIQFRDVEFSYSKQKVLGDVSFQIIAGRTTVLFGPSGAGKTTCLRLIAGLEQPHGGEIDLFGTCVASALTMKQPGERNVGYCFQEAALWQHLKVIDHVLVPLRAAYPDKVKRNQRCNQILNTFALNELRNRYPDQLSGGERKRLEFARAVASGPRILVLDEPLAGADEPRRFELMPYIRECASQNCTLVIVTHHREEAFALADDLLVFDTGCVLNCGPVEEVFRAPRSDREAFLLGYRTMVNATCVKGKMQTPFGLWDTLNECEGNGVAAWTMDGIIISPQGNNEGVVESCEFIGRGYRILLSLNEIKLTAFSMNNCGVGETVKFEISCPPAWISKR